MPDARAVRFHFAFVLAVLAPRVASAQANYTPSVTEVVVENPVFDGVANTMMYTVTATVDDAFDDARHQARVGFAPLGPRGTALTNCSASAEYAWSPVTQVFDTTATKTWTLYNFQPGTRYYYVIRTGTGGNYKFFCGTLSTAAAPMPTIPQNLAALNLAVDNSSDAYFTKYVMFDVDGCNARKNYLVAIDADSGNIVWYLDIPAVTGIPLAKLGGWRFQARGQDHLASDRILATISADDHRGYLYELELDGTVVASKNFDLLETGENGHLCDGTEGQSTGPCPHHDAFKSDVTGETHVLVVENSNLGTRGNGTWGPEQCTESPYRFVGDGWQTLSEDYGTAVGTYYLMDDDLGYDPRELPGPHAPAACATAPGWQRTLSPRFSWIDWLHTNSISGTADGQFLDLSLREWDQIIRVSADGSSIEWRLASDSAYSDFGELSLGGDVVTGEAAFGSQHDVHAVDDSTYLLLDNQGNRHDTIEGVGSRVLSISFDTVAWSATIDRSWALVDNDPTAPSTLHCPTKGSGQLVPGDTTGRSVLALCHEHFVIEELNEPSGAETPPSLYISFPEEDAEVCGGTGRPSGVNGWFRAYPLATLGDF